MAFRVITLSMEERSYIMQREAEELSKMQFYDLALEYVKRRDLAAIQEEEYELDSLDEDNSPFKAPGCTDEALTAGDATLPWDAERPGFSPYSTLISSEANTGVASAYSFPPLSREPMDAPLDEPMNADDSFILDSFSADERDGLIFAMELCTSEDAEEDISASTSFSSSASSGPSTPRSNRTTSASASPTSAMKKNHEGSLGLKKKKSVRFATGALFAASPINAEFSFEDENPFFGSYDDDGMVTSELFYSLCNQLDEDPVELSNVSVGAEFAFSTSPSTSPSDSGVLQDASGILNMSYRARKNKERKERKKRSSVSLKLVQPAAKPRRVRSRPQAYITSTHPLSCSCKDCTERTCPVLSCRKLCLGTGDLKRHANVHDQSLHVVCKNPNCQSRMRGGDATLSRVDSLKRHCKSQMGRMQGCFEWNREEFARLEGEARRRKEAAAEKRRKERVREKERKAFSREVKEEIMLERKLSRMEIF